MPGLTANIITVPARIIPHRSTSSKFIRERGRMDLEVEVHEVDSYLSVKAVGRYSLANLSGLFDQIRAESDNRTGQGVILDVTKVTGTVPIMDMFALGEHCSKAWKPPFRVAILSPEEWVYRFFENVARNRGVQVAVVSSQVAAREWLAKG